MLLQQTADSQFSIIPGNLNCLIRKWDFCVSYVLLDQKYVHAGQVHQNLLYPFQSTSRLFSTPGYRLGCDSGCCLRPRNLVSAGEAAIPNFPSDSWQKHFSMQLEYFSFVLHGGAMLSNHMKSCVHEIEFCAHCLWKKLITKTINNCRYMGTITEVSDADPVRWPSSYWRSVKVRVFLLDFSC